MMELKSRQFLGVISSFLVILSFSIVSPQADINRKNGSSSSSSKSPLNYIVTGDLPDGEHEVRMRFGDTIFREASITDNSPSKRKHKMSLMLRQVAVGSDFLQLIYKVNDRAGAKKTKLVECEVINDWNSANEFRRQFQRQLERVGVHIPEIAQQQQHFQNEDEDNLDLSPSSSSASLDLDLESNWEDLEFDPEAKEPIHKSEIDLSHGLVDLRNVTVRILREDEVDSNLKAAFDIQMQKKFCRRLHRRLRRDIEQRRQLAQDTQKNNNGSRRRRDTISFGIIPGTLWCGFDKVASQRSQLGAHIGPDFCCRQHDSCQVSIAALSTQYGIFNYRMNTLSHCSCDERFRSCLKQTNTGAADFVGKLFFNVVQTKCFVLKPEATCTKRSWWGKCLKTEYKKQAHLRDPLPY